MFIQYLKKTKVFSLVIFFVSFYYLLSTLQAVKFIDVDEFNFTKGGVRSGLRLVVFDVELQKFDSITYYNFPANVNRRPEGTMIEDFSGINIDYNGDVTLFSQADDTMVRTCGRLIGAKEIQVKEDDQLRRLAYKSLVRRSGFKLMTYLNGKFGEQYRRSEFKVMKITLPSKTKEETGLNAISGDQNENRIERGKLGELATRMTFFAHGFFEKVPSQDNSGQGTDGIYFKKVKGVNKDLFFTESKNRSESVKARKAMNSQLSEKDIYDNVRRLPESVFKDQVLDFLKASPDRVFKASHRLLKNGVFEGSAEKLNFVNFNRLGKGVFSPEKEKTAFIAPFAHNFRTPEEMIKVMFHYYNIETEQQKLSVMLKVFDQKPEDLKQLVETYKDELTTAARALDFEVDTDVKIEYNRENLARFLIFVKKSFKRGGLKGINEGLKKIRPEYEDLAPPVLTKLSDFKRYPDFHKTKDHEDLWKLLLEAFSDQYEQAIVEKTFD